MVDMRLYDQSLVNQYLDTSMALIGANASALLAATNNNHQLAQSTVGFIHPLLYQKRLSTALGGEDSTAQLFLIPGGLASGIDLAKLTKPNQEVYDDISEAFDAANCSKTVLVQNNSKVNEYCYIPASSLTEAATSKPIQIVRD